MFTAASFFHSALITASGTFAAFWILYKLSTLQTTYTSDWTTIPAVDGWRLAIFGMLIGSIDYLAGNVSENLVDEVFLSVGFRNHYFTNDAVNKITSIAVVSPTGVSTTQTTETYSGTSVAFNYAKLMKM